jgi:hypothetical protein
METKQRGNEQLGQVEEREIAVWDSKATGIHATGDKRGGNNAESNPRTWNGFPSAPQ